MRTRYWIAFIIIGILLGSSFTLADSTTIPNLIGNWKGSCVGHGKLFGYINDTSGDMILNISEQEGMAFNGTYTQMEISGKTSTKGFSGIIDPDMKTFYISQYDAGIGIGTLVSPDDMSMIYLETGEDAMAFLDNFVREKTV